MSGPVLTVEESATVLVEYGRVPQVSVALIPGMGVAIGGAVMLAPVGGTGGRPVVQHTSGRAVTRDQYCSADRMNSRALGEMMR
ncbi:hypothetical protein [Rhodococcus sp. CH91]|uniref:hypothetical protein n=1 Tax=Rhodococcus sp. CH91 TaxID=2910256 RepID=UPI001F4A9F6F|nr:hypothetical protein [Rhodococcus sp. CH91]